MTEACGDCREYNPDLGETESGKVKMPGFGMCRHLPSHEYRSARPWGCAFNPSRYEPKDGNAPAKEEAEPTAVQTPSRPTLELT